MIVTETEHGWRCITQPDHAHLAHDILALWRADGLPEHPRRGELLTAVLEHDNGWREADSAPRLDPERGCPHDFISHPHGDRLSIWRRGIDRFAEKRPYVAALILEHAIALHRERRSEPEWHDFLTECDARRLEFEDELEIDAKTLATDYRWLHIADLLSLAACAGRHAAFERQGLKAHFDGQTLELEPFPLAGATSFTVACRYLHRGEYGSDTELATALARCRWQSWTLRIAAGSPPSAHGRVGPDARPSRA
jgi:hypothetical protein